MFSITANSDALRRSIEDIRRGLSETQSGPIADGLRRAGAIYLGAMRRRFDSASHGDGTWPDLAESTKRGRLAARGSFASAKRASAEKPVTLAVHRRMEKEKAKLRVRVLRARLGNARTLADEHKIKAEIKRVKAKAGLRANQSDLAHKSLGKFAILADTGTLKNSLSEGRPGNVQQPIEGGIEVGTNIHYAVYHQLGTSNGRPPKREILVQPDPDTESRMQKVIHAAVREIVRNSVNKK